MAIEMSPEKSPINKDCEDRIGEGVRCLAGEFLRIQRRDWQGGRGIEVDRPIARGSAGRALLMRIAALPCVNARAGIRLGRSTRIETHQTQDSLDRKARWSVPLAVSGRTCHY
jgi:hypothetical protein